MRGHAVIADLVCRYAVNLLLTGRSSTTPQRGGVAPRSLFVVFAATLPVIPVSEAIAFKALAYSVLCHSTTIVDGAGR